MKNKLTLKELCNMSIQTQTNIWNTNQKSSIKALDELLYSDRLTLLQAIDQRDDEIYRLRWLLGNICNYHEQKDIVLIQRLVRKRTRNRKMKKFIKLTQSDMFKKVFYHPNNMGGKWLKKNS